MNDVKQINEINKKYYSGVIATSHIIENHHITKFLPSFRHMLQLLQISIWKDPTPKVVKTKIFPFKITCYAETVASRHVALCCEADTKKLTFSITAVPLFLSR